MKPSVWKHIFSMFNINKHSHVSLAIKEHSMVMMLIIGLTGFKLVDLLLS